MLLFTARGLTKALPISIKFSLVFTNCRRFPPIFAQPISPCPSRLFGLCAKIFIDALLQFNLYFHNYRNMETKTAIDAFSALSQESRLAVVKLLVKAGPNGEAAGRIADALGVPAPTMSFHLKELERAGLILSRKAGRSVIYAADYGGIRDLVDFLLADCCQGDKRLCGPYVIKEMAS